MNSETIEVLSVGELLGDFIGQEPAHNLEQTHSFDRFQGGSTVNFTANLHKLGINAKVAACVGQENLGNYLIQCVANMGIDTSLIKQHPSLPTSIVLVSKTTGTPDFIPYRMADCHIVQEDVPQHLLGESKIFHTTCWPLSRKPAQETVLHIAKEAEKLNLKLSLDLNYAQEVWPDRQEAHQVVKSYISNKSYIKLSTDDAERFFGESMEPQKLYETLFEWGAGLIVHTLGSKGSRLLNSEGENHFIPAPKTEVADATGAGDAYWAGFIAAHLKGFDLETCGHKAAEVAKIKLQCVGPLQLPQNFKI